MKNQWLSETFDFSVDISGINSDYCEKLFLPSFAEKPTAR